MKKLIALIILLSANPPSYATTCAYAEFQATHVDLLYCQNGGYWNYSDLLYYKGITRLLDHYIGEALPDERLGLKRVKLNVYSSIFADIVFSLGQNEDEFRIFSRGRLEPIHFLRALIYFTSPKWQPFPGDRPYHDRAVTDEVVLEELNKVFDAAGGEVDQSLVKGKRFELSELDALQIVFEDGDLFYELDGIQLEEQVQDPIPTRIGNRYLLGSDRGIRVYEGGKLIAEKNWQTRRAPGPYIPLAFGSGTHIDYYDEFGVFLIYSVETNTFHEISLKEPRGWPKGRMAAQHGRDQVRSTFAEQVLQRIGFSSLPG